MINKILWVVFCCIVFICPYKAQASDNVLSEVKYLEARVVDVEKNEPVTDNKDQSVVVQIVNDKHEYEFTNQSTIYEKNDRLLSVGDLIIVSVQNVNNNQIIGFVDYQKENLLIVSVFVLVMMVLIIGRWVGFRSLLSFAWIGIVLLVVLLRNILIGYDPVWLTIGSAVLIVFGASLILNGWNKRMMIVAFSTILGLCFALIFMYIMSWGSRFSVYGLEETTMFKMNPILSKLNMMHVIYASILIGTIGSIMDMSISIVAGLDEMLSKGNEKGIRKIDAKEIWLAGMNIGRNVMAAETNTMILAYFGSSMMIWLMAIVQNYQWNILVNYNLIFVELIRILSAASGILISIPITAWLSSKWLYYQRRFNE